MIKEGMKVEMVENCIDNPNIKEGWVGTIDYINYDGVLSVEFNHFIYGNGISGNNRNSHQWYVKPEQVKELL